MVSETLNWTEMPKSTKFPASRTALFSMFLNAIKTLMEVTETFVKCVNCVVKAIKNGLKGVSGKYPNKIWQNRCI